MIFVVPIAVLDKLHLPSLFLLSLNVPQNLKWLHVDLKVLISLQTIVELAENGTLDFKNFCSTCLVSIETTVFYFLIQFYYSNLSICFVHPFTRDIVTAMLLSVEYKTWKCGHVWWNRLIKLYLPFFSLTFILASIWFISCSFPFPLLVFRLIWFPLPVWPILHSCQSLLYTSPLTLFFSYLLCVIPSLVFLFR